MSRPRIVVAGRVGVPRLTDDLALAGLLRVLRGTDVSVVVVAADADHTVRTHRVVAVPADVAALATSAMRSADLVLWAGGRVVADDDGPAGLTRHLAQICMARAAGVAVMPYGIEVGELHTKLMRRLARTIVPLASPGLVSDEASAVAWMTLGGKECAVAPDLAFALQPPLVRSEDHMVVCLRPVARADQAAFEVATATAVERVALQTGMPVRFLSLDAGADDLVHRRVAERITGVEVSHTVADLVGVLPELGRARVVVTMHHHGLVGAILGGRPCIAVDHHGDLRRLADELSGIDDRVIRTMGATPQELVDLPRLVGEVLGRDADVIDVREELRGRLIRARSVIERTLYAAHG